MEEPCRCSAPSVHVPHSAEAELAPLSWSSEILGYTCTGSLRRPVLDRKKMGVNEEQEESSLVGRMLIELGASGSLS